MKTQKILSGILFLSISAGLLEAAIDKDSIYAGGVKDAVMITDKVLKSEIDPHKKRKYLNGYIVFKDASKLDTVDIIKYSAIATKLGYTPEYFKIKGKDSILFAVESRMPDATATASRLKKYGIGTNIAEINKEVNRVVLVANSATRAIDEYLKNTTKKDKEKIATLEKYIAELKGKPNSVSLLSPPEKVLKCKETNTIKGSQPIVKNVIKKEVVRMAKIDFTKLQVVNRVVTEKYLRKYKKRPKDIRALNSYAASRMTVEIVKERNRIVARNIKKTYGKKIPNFKSFKKLYNYIIEHGAITPKGELLLHGRLFKVGDVISNDWVLSACVYKTGVVVVKHGNSDYHIVLKKK